MLPIRSWPSFIHARPFDEAWRQYELDDEDLSRLQLELVKDPEAGDVVSGTGGLRKLRFARKGEGKSGSLRIGYANIPNHGLVLLMVAYEKKGKSDLTPDDKRDIKIRLTRLKDALDSK